MIWYEWEEEQMAHALPGVAECLDILFEDGILLH